MYSFFRTLNFINILNYFQRSFTKWSTIFSLGSRKIKIESPLHLVERLTFCLINYMELYGDFHPYKNLILFSATYSFVFEKHYHTKIALLKINIVVINICAWIIKQYITCSCLHAAVCLHANLLILIWNREIVSIENQTISLTNVQFFAR